MKTNPHLIWDYTFSEAEQKTDYFKRWYIARVLQRGGADDIQGIGLPTIQKHLPDLNLPAPIREFWNWVFEQRSLISR